MFALHPQLAADTYFIVDLALCRVQLMDNAAFPWIIMVPRVTDAREIIDLSRPQRTMLMDEIAAASEVMRTLWRPDKLNIAALGNQVPQLHIHVIARFAADAAWPHPVWGGAATRYPDSAAASVTFQEAFAEISA